MKPTDDGDDGEGDVLGWSPAHMSPTWSAIQPQSIVIGGSLGCRRSLRDRPADGVGGEHPQVAVAVEHRRHLVRVLDHHVERLAQRPRRTVSHDWAPQRQSVRSCRPSSSAAATQPSSRPSPPHPDPVDPVLAPSPGGPRRPSPSPVAPAPARAARCVSGSSESRFSPRSEPRKSTTKSLAGVPQDVRGGVVLLEHAADVEDGDAVTQLDGLVDVVGDEDDGLAQPVAGGRGTGPGAGPARWGRRPRMARPSACTCGSAASALATPTRCCCPPDSSDG